MSEKKLSKVEKIKAASNFLRGSIPEELLEDTDHFNKDNMQLLKFHGIYQQANRDSRVANKKAGKGQDYSFMVRTALPGGFITCEQYLLLDELSDKLSDGAMRLTTRQGIQYHNISKNNLRPLITELHQKLITTFTKCGDVVRNINLSPAPLARRNTEEVLKFAKDLDVAVKPQTKAYLEMWVDGEKESTNIKDTSVSEEEPLYGETYLPRKFKIGFAWEEDNSIDALSHDVAIIPKLADEKLIGFTILAGGGFGMSHAKKETHPCLAKPLCDCKPEEMVEVVKKIVEIQRDNGNRADRKFARMKYLIEEWGIEKFKAELDARWGSELAAPSEVNFKSGSDHLGWHKQADGKNFYGFFVENGRIKDTEAYKLRTAIREIIKQISPDIRLTAQQNILFCGLEDDDKPKLEAILEEFGVRKTEDHSRPILQSMACPALPTCGLALTESERVLPEIIREVNSALEEVGLKDFDMFTRMTGCPNGCARPYSAELGIVGRSVDSFNIYLGGSRENTRINVLFKDKVKQEELVPSLKPVFKEFAENRQGEEAFGDFCHRVGVDTLRDRYVGEANA